MRRQAPSRTCPACSATWKHDRAGAPPRLCPACRVVLRWCSTGKHAVQPAAMLDRSRCRPCGVVVVRRQQTDKREWLAAIKVDQGCADCGYREHPDALDFDHLPGTRKEFDLGRGVLSRSWDSIRQEVEKCEVRCANCHRIVTATRKATDAERRQA